MGRALDQDRRVLVAEVLQGGTRCPQRVADRGSAAWKFLLRLRRIDIGLKTSRSTCVGRR